MEIQRVKSKLYIDGVMTKRPKRHSQHFTGEVSTDADIFGISTIWPIIGIGRYEHYNIDYDQYWSFYVKKLVLTVIIGKQFFPRYYRLQVNPATPRERCVQAHLELAELVEDLRTLTCYAEIRHAIGYLLPRNRD
ncbi:hypothetical protein NQ317_002083 [Molorchus minor]|uniref:Uncharacterized protein n=1 Tax=Molorchus minor TaxID=1323400 RepID=A0ABQ9JNI5_9CUCU|nr:hypothetical protein NQ317_002083 [Molorchus minor]